MLADDGNKTQLKKTTASAAARNDLCDKVADETKRLLLRAMIAGGARRSCLFTQNTRRCIDTVKRGGCPVRVTSNYG